MKISQEHLSYKIQFNSYNYKKIQGVLVSFANANKLPYKSYIDIYINKLKREKFYDPSNIILLEKVDLKAFFGCYGDGEEWKNL